MRGHSGDVQSACAVLKEHQRVHPAQVGQVDVHEIAGDEALGCVRMVYLLAPRTFAWLALVCWSTASKNTEASYKGSWFPEEKGPNRRAPAIADPPRRAPKSLVTSVSTVNPPA